MSNFRGKKTHLGMRDTQPKCILGQSLALILIEYEIKSLGTPDSPLQNKSFVTASGKMSQICTRQFCREMLPQSVLFQFNSSPIPVVYFPNFLELASICIIVNSPVIYLKQVGTFSLKFYFERGVFRLDFRRLPGPVFDPPHPPPLLILPALSGDECGLIFPNSGW